MSLPLLNCRFSIEEKSRLSIVPVLAPDRMAVLLPVLSKMLSPVVLEVEAPLTAALSLPTMASKPVTLPVT